MALWKKKQPRVIWFDNQENISEEQVIAAAKAVGVLTTLSPLQKGYDTYLDDSRTLKVRNSLTIARALLKDAPSSYLDEATSSVDTRTEELILKAMDKTLWKVGLPCHCSLSLSTIRNADLTCDERWEYY